LFKEQIFAGGPVTVTHPDARRWFMTIPEAVSLVIKTTGLSADNGLYMLDMGDPVRIVDFARQMIKFYGYDEESIPITFVGMRPGEKKIERLWSDDETPVDTEHPRIVKITFPSGVQEVVSKIIKELEPVLKLDTEQPGLFRNRHKLRKIINRYFPAVAGPENEPEY
ncbi:MAG: polysaccharide biosynthesis protein, partial [Spirochaetes bacterium]